MEEMVTMSEELTTDGFVAVPGGRIWHRVVNANHPGIPLLIVHGGPGLSHDYLVPLSRLGIDRPIVFYDQLGCGRSDKPGNPALWTLERFAVEIQAIRDSLGLDRVHILGHSNGSLIVARYVSAGTPAGVSSAILSNPVLSASRLMADGRKLLAELPRSVRETIMKAVDEGSFDSADYGNAWEVFEKRHQCRMQTMPSILRKTFDNADFTMFDSTWGLGIPFVVTGSFKSVEAANWMSHVGVPVLFITGRYDYVSPESVEVYHQNTPNSEVGIVEDASHFPHLERSDHFLEIVKDFLQRVESLSAAQPKC